MTLHPAAWIGWATCAGVVAFTTTDPFYLGLLVRSHGSCSWPEHVPGPGARSFRTFALAGLVDMTIRTALVFLGTIDAEQRGVRGARRARGWRRCWWCSAPSTR